MNYMLFYLASNVIFDMPLSGQLFMFYGAITGNNELFFCLFVVL